MTPEEVGLSTLEHLSECEALNSWMYQTIRPYVKGNVLEIGSGIGNISEQFVKDGYPIYLSDYSPAYCRSLRRRFAAEPLVKDVITLDLADPNLEENHPDLIGAFNTIFALNVVEHIKDHERAILNCRKMLAPKGNVIILVPSYPALYNILDLKLEHFRRYSTGSLRRLLSPDFVVTRMQHFNLAGIAGWVWSGGLMKKPTLPAGPLKLYNNLVPLFKVVDDLTLHQVGLSVIGVGRKR